jgi:hypothetical protein
MTRGAREGSGSNRGPGGQRRAGAGVAVRGQRWRVSRWHGDAYAIQLRPAACGGDVGGVGAAGLCAGGRRGISPGDGWDVDWVGCAPHGAGTRRRVGSWGWRVAGRAAPCALRLWLRGWTGHVLRGRQRSVPARVAAAGMPRCFHPSGQCEGKTTL